MNPATPKTELPPSTQLRKVVFGGSRLLFLGLALGLFCLNSNAATTVVITAQSFSMTDRRFTPSDVTIGVGDTVSFYNAGGNHNVTGYNPVPPPERFITGGTGAYRNARGEVNHRTYANGDEEFIINFSN